MEAVSCAMPTAAERNALLFLASIALIGAGVRSAESARFARTVGEPNVEQSMTGQGSLGDRALAAQIDAVDSARNARTANARTANARTANARTANARTANARASKARTTNSSSRGQLPKPTNRSGTLAAPTPPLVVNVNSANATELEQLPRVGPALAARIIAWREEHGPFRTLEDLRHVRGIGPSTSALLAPAVTF